MRNDSESIKLKTIPILNIFPTFTDYPESFLNEELFHIVNCEINSNSFLRNEIELPVVKVLQWSSSPDQELYVVNDDQMNIARSTKISSLFVYSAAYHYLSKSISYRVSTALELVCYPDLNSTRIIRRWRKLKGGAGALLSHFIGPMDGWWSSSETQMNL